MNYEESHLKVDLQNSNDERFKGVNWAFFQLFPELFCVISWHASFHRVSLG
jgi:hypothetical protein